MKHLSQVETSRVVALIKDGKDFRYAARVVGVNYSVVLKLWLRYEETGKLCKTADQCRKRKKRLARPF